MPMIPGVLGVCV